MATADQVKALVKSHAEGDDERFYAVALQVAARAARSGHSAIAQELRDLVDTLRSRQPSTSAARRPTPVVRPRGELAGLLDVSYPENTLVALVLEERVQERLYRVVLEQRQRDVLAAQGFSPERRLLLIGPPGTGKTMTARAVAGELRLPLFSVRLDSLITKMMGETAAKLRLIFDALAETRGVYLFDEVDALAGERAQGNDVGEIRRVLNSFLQFLEQDPSESLIVAASNHPQMLDRALFRRFESVIEYPLPSPPVAEQVIRNRLATVPTVGIDWEVVREASRSHSHAELTLAAESAAKAAILTDGKVTTHGLVCALRDRLTDMDR
ncbi:ATP-binding protein [Frankia sp. Cr2]|uniref:AAA family ATPase n=1 Tax=Frankia sp. Cr2 TaxID=3073932 RepID=UPI002AD25BA8|nr:ATP-binding protein [Frankia sp. Cr2]